MKSSENSGAPAMFPAVAALVPALLLLSILAGLVTAGATAGIDDWGRYFVRQHSSPPLTLTMKFFTQLGSSIVWLPGTVLGFLVLWKTGRPMAARTLLITMAGSAALNYTMKIAFHRPRPVPFFDLVAPASYSFPSGHALESFCFYGIMAALLARGLRKPAARLAIWAISALIVFMVGLSRIYLGVHYPSDVLGGYFSALVWSLAVYVGRGPREAPAAGQS